jgi:hypothetical protein
MGVAARRAAERLGRAEEGLTVVEVVVAGMILVLGSLGVLGMVDTATRNTFRAEQSQTVSNVLQREMEEIRELPYEEVGLSALPSHESGENNPNSRVSGTSFYTKRNGTGLRSMVSEGSVAAGPEPFQVEDVKGEIYRYVVWDACPAPSWTCVDGDLLKRAIVAVKLDATAAGGSDRRYQEIQSQFVDPEAEPTENPGPTPGGAAVTSWPLWLTDTSCDAEAPQDALERAEVGDHAAHNTRGLCADGLSTGNEPGAPDLLWPEAPELSDESPVYDYATDVEPEVDPDKDKGLQVMKGSDCGAMPATEIATTSDADGAMFKKLHKWVTPQVPSEVTDLALTGEGTLSLWTESIEHGVYAATICVWVFIREEGADTALTRPFESLPYTTHTETTWPNTGWAEITVPLDLEDEEGGEIPLPPGSRLGLALSVDNDSSSGIQTLYDEPSFDSRLSMYTTGTLPEWP